MDKVNSQVEIIEVGPRDGLQNEKTLISPEVKAQYIQKLALAGVKNIELGSFVSPSSIPQLADTETVLDLLAEQNITNQFSRKIALVPNLQGLARAVQQRHIINEVAVFTATSDAFTQKNIKATVAESLDRIGSIIPEAKKYNLKIRAYVSTVFGCPYEGIQAARKVASISNSLLELGVDEISLGDTIGVATPKLVGDVLREVFPVIKQFNKPLALHFHDTYGMALANTLRALELGVRSFDSSSGGLGGCPYARGASGNLATEDLLYFLHGEGIQTGLDLPKLLDASEFIFSALQRHGPSKTYQALRAFK